MDDAPPISCLNKRKREADIEDDSCSSTPSPSDSEQTLLENVSPATTPIEHADSSSWLVANSSDGELWSPATKRPRVQSPLRLSVRRVLPLRKAPARKAVPVLGVPRPPLKRLPPVTSVASSSHGPPFKDFLVHSTCEPRQDILIDIQSPNVASMQPLVTRHSLKELDFDSIVRNPQLRHDLMFDAGLQFRPSNDRSHNKNIRDLYWSAVIREVESGCTCVTFDLQGKPHAIECMCAGTPVIEPPLRPTLCDSTSPCPTFLTVRMPSRIQPLLKEFLEVLISVLKPIYISRKPLPLPQSYKRHKQEFKQQSAYLRSIFSPQLIEQELRLSKFDPSNLFRVIGSMLKRHCAPMRDVQLECVVEAASQCTTKMDVINVIRMCLNLLEFMKLDIANHQLQHLRPALSLSASRFELKAFTARLTKGKCPPLTTSETWLRSAHQNLLVSEVIPHPTQHIHYHTLTRNKQIYLSVLLGLTDLIFHPPSVNSPTISKPAVIASVIQALSGFPETTYLDNLRLTQLGYEAASLAAIYMWLLLFRQLRLSVSGKHTGTVDEDARKLKTELRVIGASQLGRTFAPGGDPEGREKAEDVKRNIVLQIAMRAHSLDTNSVMAGETPSHLTKTIQLAQSWSATHMRDGSPLSSVLRNRLRDVVFQKVVANLFPTSTSLSLPSTLDKDDTFSLPPSIAQNGLTPLVEDVQALASRVSHLARIHLDTYLPLYESANGFIQRTEEP